MAFSFSFKIFSISTTLQLPTFSQITLGGIPFKITKSLKSESFVTIV